MADSYHYSFIEQKTGEELYFSFGYGKENSEIDIYNGKLGYDDILYKDGIAYRVVGIDETSTFKDYDDHGSEYYYDETVTVEKLRLILINDSNYATSVWSGEIRIDNIFVGSSVTKLVIPETIDGMPVVEIKSSACDSCGRVREIVFPDTIRKIGENAFCCGNLKELNLPKSLAFFSPYSFKCSNLESVYIPAPTVLDTGHIGEYFKGCDNLIKIIVDEGNPLYDSREHCNAIIETATNKILIACKGTMLPESITYVEDGAYRRMPRETRRAYNDRCYPREWSSSHLVLREKEAGAWSDTFTYMDVHNGVVHMFGHEKILYEGGGHLHICRDLLGMSILKLLDAWKVEFKCSCPTWNSFSQEIKTEFTQTNAYYGQGIRHFKYFLDKYNIKYDEISREGRRLLLYLHGFGSSGEGSTVKTLQELLPDWLVLAPDIPVDSAEALPFLKDLCIHIRPELIVGTSMGGMYAQQMRGFKRICVNPAFYMSGCHSSSIITIIKNFLNPPLLSKGTFDFYNHRKNGDTSFTITQEIIKHYSEMETHQFDCITDEDRENVYGLFADNDTIVNCEDVFRQHYDNVIHFHGEHRLNQQVIKEVLVPLIKEITNNCDN